MITKRTARSLAALVAVLALSVASVAACACAHHQPEQKAEALSCHAPSHDETPTEPSNPDATNLSEQCSCFVRQPSPFISAKTETKRSKAEKSVVAELGFEQPQIVVSLIAIADLQLPHAIDYYLGEFSYSGPSRAPPRL